MCNLKFCTNISIKRTPQDNSLSSAIQACTEYPYDAQNGTLFAQKGGEIVLSFLARSSLAATSLAPMLLAYAVLYAPENWKLSVGLLIGAIALGLVCKLILIGVQNRVPKRTIHAQSVKIADQNMMAFIVAYLFPLVFLRSADPEAVKYGVLAFVFVLLVVAIYRSNAFFFNPTMALFWGYHFYEITTDQDFTYLLVSKRKIVNTKDSIQGKELSPYMFLEAEG